MAGGSIRPLMAESAFEHTLNWGRHTSRLGRRLSERNKAAAHRLRGNAKRTTGMGDVYQRKRRERRHLSTPLRTERGARGGGHGARAATAGAGRKPRAAAGARRAAGRGRRGGRRRVEGRRRKRERRRAGRGGCRQRDARSAARKARERKRPPRKTFRGGRRGDGPPVDAGTRRASRREGGPDRRPGPDPRGPRTADDPGPMRGPGRHGDGNPGDYHSMWTMGLMRSRGFSSITLKASSMASKPSKV